MSKLLMSVAGAILINLLVPVPAAAQFWSVVRWLNDMSGPQMTGSVLDVPVIAGYQEQREDPQIFLNALDERSGARRKWVASARVGYFLNTQALGGEAEVNRLISGLLLGAGATYTVASKVDVTGSFDMFRFGGQGVADDFWSPTVTAGIAVRPFDETDMLFRPLRLSLSYQKFLDSFSGDRFGAPGTFESRREGIWLLGVGWTLF